MEKTNYINYLNNISSSNYILNMEQFAKAENIPVIQKPALDYIIHMIKITKSKNILEIGTAIGYSAINFALVRDNIYVTSIERDEKMYLEAKKNISKANLDDRIKLIYHDALDFDDKKLTDNYDLLFIDAAKSKYQLFFEKYAKYVKQNGLIITDNVLFHDLLFCNNIKNRNTRQLVNKIKKFNEWLKDNKSYDTCYFNIGDGIAVSIKK